MTHRAFASGPPGEQLRVFASREVNKVSGMLSCLEKLLVKHLRHLWKPPAYTKSAVGVCHLHRHSVQ